MLFTKVEMMFADIHIAVIRNPRTEVMEVIATQAGGELMKGEYRQLGKLVGAITKVLNEDKAFTDRLYDRLEPFQRSF